MKRDIKSWLSTLMCLVLCMCTICFYRNVDNVRAEEVSYIVELLNIEQYSDNTAPIPKTEGYEEWIFAGWYEDANCENCIYDKSEITGEKYAKYVPADVLSVRCQNRTGTVSDTPSTSMRVVTTVDSVYYREVGFEIKIGNNRTSTSTNKVYSSISSKDEGTVFKYSPDVFSNASKYFSTVTFTNIPMRGYAEGIYIKPYWVTPDGTKVYGMERYVRVEDKWEDVVNVPVRLYADKSVAAGRLDVHYDTDKYTFIGNETGDLGDLFDEMHIRDNGEGTVVCVGNTLPVEDIKANGMMVSLRFKKIKDITTETVFTVDNEEFSNKNESFVYTSDGEFDVFDVVNKIISK